MAFNAMNCIAAAHLTANLAEMEVRLCKPGEIEIMQWTVDGTPESAITTRREDSVLASAVCMFNRAKDVIAAPPGIQEVHKLGPMKHTAI